MHGASKRRPANHPLRYTHRWLAHPPKIPAAYHPNLELSRALCPSKRATVQTPSRRSLRTQGWISHDLFAALPEFHPITPSRSYRPERSACCPCHDSIISCSIFLERTARIALLSGLKGIGSSSGGGTAPWFVPKGMHAHGCAPNSKGRQFAILWRHASTVIILPPRSLNRPSCPISTEDKSRPPNHQLLQK
jgi:hypothetical protein